LFEVFDFEAFCFAVEDLIDGKEEDTFNGYCDTSEDVAVLSG
jgi:hypothetical protein